MAPDSSLSAIETNPNKAEDPPRCKYRIRFCKASDLRLVSHHDLMHVCERMLRRADLSVPVTQGFNPRPKMWFASALALGIAGLNEVLEFELSQPLAAEEVHRRLATQVPPGMEILSVRAIDVKTAARVRRAWYRLPLSLTPSPSAKGPREMVIHALRQRCEGFLQRKECWVERMRPHPRRINIRPFVHEIHVNDESVEMALWITSNGAARPEEVIAALGLTELLSNGAVIERTDLEVYDELPPGTEGPPLIRSAIEEISEMSTNDKGLPEETPISSRPTAIISNPMSFDS
jgi:radical SAM-linked protein